jgi:hypothetical protein
MWYINSFYKILHCYVQVIHSRIKKVKRERYAKRHTSAPDSQVYLPMLKYFLSLETLYIGPTT